MPQALIGANPDMNPEDVRKMVESMSGFIDPQSSSDNVRPATFYLPEDLAYDQVQDRLTRGRRRIEANSQLIREMQSGNLTWPHGTSDRQRPGCSIC